MRGRGGMSGGRKKGRKEDKGRKMKEGRKEDEGRKEGRNEERREGRKEHPWRYLGG